MKQRRTHTSRARPCKLLRPIPPLHRQTMMLAETMATTRPMTLGKRKPRTVLHPERRALQRMGKRSVVVVAARSTARLPLTVRRHPLPKAQLPKVQKARKQNPASTANKTRRKTNAKTSRAITIASVRRFR
jgi:hypothetical protein